MLLDFEPGLLGPTILLVWQVTGPSLETRPRTNAVVRPRLLSLSSRYALTSTPIFSLSFFFSFLSSDMLKRALAVFALRIKTCEKQIGRSPFQLSCVRSCENGRSSDMFEPKTGKSIGISRVSSAKLTFAGSSITFAVWIFLEISNFGIFLCDSSFGYAIDELTLR